MIRSPLFSLCLGALLVFGCAPSASGRLFGWASGSDAEKRGRTSIRIDPRNIVSAVTKFGGVVLPTSVEEDIKAIERVCACDEAFLDVINRELEVRNFTVDLPMHGGGERPALRVGRFYVRWDSYMKPCIEIEVDDVDVLVEFVNLFLTKNNWNELQDEGFPPKMYDDPNEQSAKASTFVRIGSINLSGEVTLRVHSRPLHRAVCPDLVLDLDMLDDLTGRIKDASREARDKGGRPGCTTEELYDIIQVYFKDRLKKMVASTARDVVVNKFESKTVQQTRKLFADAKEGAVDYALSAGEKSGQEVEASLMAQLKKWGLEEKDAEYATSSIKSALFKTVVASRTDSKPPRAFNNGEERGK